MTRWQAWNIRLSALCAGVVLSQASMAATLSLTPVPTSPVLGSSVSFDVKIADVVDLYGYQFTLNYDPAKLQFASRSEGTFLSAVNSTEFVTQSMGTGAYSVYGSLIGPISGASGNGTLARLTFNTLGAGLTTLNFTDSIFLNSSLNDITLTAQPLSLTVSAVPEPATLALFGAGLAGLALMRRRKAETV